MRKTVLITALFAGAMATPAMAQDSEGAASPGTFHVTGIVGYDSPDSDADASGVVYGVSAGYDFNIGRNFFIGPEAELTSSSIEECASGIERAGDKLCIEAGRDIYLGARAGFRFGEEGRHKAYIGGGYTNASFEVNYDANLAGTTGDFNLDDDLDGFRLKAGAELGVARNVFVRAEYRYSNYDEADIDRHQVVAGVGIRF
jgi:outer membrane immunogenic protein